MAKLRQLLIFFTASIALSCSQQPDEKSLVLDDLTKQDNSALAKSCGFESRESLISEAKRVLSSFHNLKRIDPLFWVDGDNKEIRRLSLDSMQTAEKRHQNERPAFLTSYPDWAPKIYQNYDQMRNHLYLANFRVQNLIPLALTNVDDECSEEDGACTNYLEMSVVLNADFASRLVKDRGHEHGVSALMATLGHEIGHYTVDLEEWHSGKFSTYQDMRAAHEINPLRYHLLVDAVGTLLSNIDTPTFVKALRMIGEGEGDVSDRISCLERLP